MTTNKYYVVWKGLETGIFTNWKDCQKNVQGFPGAKFKSFQSMEEAKTAWENGWQGYYGTKVNNANKTAIDTKPSLNVKKHYIEESICVDAACSGNPGAMEYQGVYTKTGKTIFHFGPILGTNNIGEFLAIVHGLAYLKKKNLSIPIYSDSQTAIKWVQRKKANTNLPVTKETEKVWSLIKRGEQWLKTNSYTNPILKWETELWGENKADFGRK